MSINSNKSTAGEAARKSQGGIWEVELIGFSD